MLVHSWGCVFNSHSRIGEYCTIHSCVCIGSTEKGIPKIGNNVTIGANVVIIGETIIGDNVDIGAGSVVSRSVQDNGVVYGKAAIVHRIKQ